MKTEHNPFITKGYIDEEHFCDRKEETDKLIKNINNQINSTLFSPRKMGKTGLIQHIFSKISQQKEINCLYIDLYATQNIHDFTQLLANAIFKTFPVKKSLANKFLDTFKNWRPIVSFDPLTGVPELSFDLTSQQINNQSISQLLKYLEKLDTPFAIAFDEFQQITFYPEENVEAILRSTIQHLQNCTFIFSGSHATLMHQMFMSVKRPFYNSTSNVFLNKIAHNEYQIFIKNTFEKRGFRISIEAIDFILNFTTGYTYHTQFICNQIFSLGYKKIDTQTTIKAILMTLDEHDSSFYQYRNLITNAQWTLLKALAKEEKVFMPYSKDFIQKYQLGTTAMVKRILDSLLEKELVYHTSGSEISFYSVYDVFLMRWLQRLPV